MKKMNHEQILLTGQETQLAGGRERFREPKWQIWMKIQKMSVEQNQNKQLIN